MANTTSNATHQQDLGITGGLLHQLSETERQISMEYCSQQLGLESASLIKDIYPCTPMQVGLLLSSSKTAHAYQVRMTMEVKAREGHELPNDQSLLEALALVVQRHDALRTVFIQGQTTDQGMLQVVLDRIKPTVSCNMYDSTAEMLLDKKSLPPASMPQHHFAICRTASGGLFYRMLFHHTLIDGATLNIINREVVQALSQPLSLGIPAQYKNFVEYLAQQDAEQYSKHWASALAGGSNGHFPPQGAKRIEFEDSEPIDIVVKADFDMAHTSEVKQACKLMGVTTPALLRAAWALVLRCYIDADDVVFGTMSSGRLISLTNSADIVGPLIALLTCRAQMDDSMSVSALIRTMSEEYNKSTAYQHFPLAEIAHQQRKSSTNASTFNTLLNYIRSDAVGEIHRSEGLEVTCFHTDDPTEYDLHLYAFDRETTIALELHTAPSFMSEDHCRGILDTFRQVIHSIVADPDQPIRDLNLLGEADTSRLRQLCDIGIVCPPRQTMTQKLSHQAGLTPSSIALHSTDWTLTYGQMESLSNHIARELVLTGVKRGMSVPICMEKSVFAIVAMLAVLKASAAFVPLDPTSPPARLRQLIEQTTSPVCVCSVRTAEQMSSLQCPSREVFVMEEDISYPCEAPEYADALPPVEPSDLAYVIFTSGSTGTPKGIAVSHGALCGGVDALNEAFDVSADTTTLQFSAFTWDAICHEIFGTLSVGGVVAVPTEQERTNDLIEFINRTWVNYLFIVPTLLRLLPPTGLPHVKAITVIGEPIGLDLVQLWQERVLLRNSYGPTETIIACTAAPPFDTSNNGTSTNNIGFPVRCRAWVTMQHDHEILAPIGSVGELVIESPNLADGYCNDDARTAEVFVETPQWAYDFDLNGDHRFYKTGDLVKQCHDGSLLYICRRDGQMKVHGQRVEAGEIECQISSSLDVGLSIVAVPKTGAWRDKLVALVVLSELGRSNAASQTKENPAYVRAGDLRSEATQIIAAVRSGLSQNLPQYMIPTVWIPMHDLPILSSGKINRTLIMQWLTQDDATVYAVTEILEQERQPATEAEELLQKLWAQELSLPLAKVGVNKSFLAMGGDSINAIKLAALCRRKGLPVTVQDLLRGATIVDIAATENLPSPVEEKTEILSTAFQRYPLIQVDDYDRRNSLVDTAVLQLALRDAQEIEDIYPCTPVQRGILVAHAKASGAYNQSLSWRVPIPASTPDLDSHLRRLRAAWMALVRHHAILRTAIVETNDVDFPFLQVVLARQDDVGASSAEHAETSMPQDKCSSLGLNTLHQFKAEQGPGGTACCTLEFHHVLADANSIQILVNDLRLAYFDPSALTPSASYRQFVSYLQARGTEAPQKYWELKLADVEQCTFNGQSSAEAPSSTFVRESVDLESAQVVKLRELCSRSNITLAALANTLWAIVLRTFLGRQDACFGSLASGRDVDVDGIDRMVGPLVTLLVSHVQVESTSQRLVQLARAVQNDYLQSLEHQHFSLADVYHKLKRNGEALFNTVVNVIPFTDFAMQKAIDHEQGLVMNAHVFETPSEFDLNFDVLYSTTNINMTLAYREDFISEACARAIMSTVSHIVIDLLEDPNVQIGQLKLCEPSEQESLSDWTPEHDLPSRLCLHESVELRVLEHPDKQAVCAHDGDFTYRQVWNLSTDIAQRLVAHGVGPGIFVPFTFEKSRWAIVAVLAILKAGGCCVPLDPSFPDSRLRYMVELVNAKVALTSSVQQVKLEALIGATIVVGAECFDPIIWTQDHLPSPATGVVPSDPAWLIFTSGSTGYPKGGVLEHHSIEASLRLLHDRCNFNAESRVLQFAAYVFDVSIEEVVGILTYGGCCCIPSEHDRVNKLAGAMESMAVNWLDFVTSVLRVLTPTEVPSLKTVCMGGEPLGDDLIELWTPHVAMYNIFGPSETACSVTVSRRLQKSDHGTNIGKAYGCRVWIVDPTDHDILLPPGAVGEMFFEGRQVGRGYYGNPTQTKAAFIEDPVWSRGKSSSMRRRMYKTGDLACYDGNGELVFMGRKDHQTKIRGHRIELAEIEYYLDLQPLVRLVAVFVPSKGPLKQTLVAVIVASDNEAEENLSASQDVLSFCESAANGSRAVQIEDLSGQLRAALPAHMCPELILEVRSMPKLLSGKINRRIVKESLEQLDVAACNFLRRGNRKIREPTTDIERWLQALWAHALNLASENVSIDMAFLALGGDSLSAIKVAAQARASGIGLTVRDLLQPNTIADLSQKYCEQSLAMIKTTNGDTLDYARNGAGDLPADPPLTPFALVNDLEHILGVCKTELGLDVAEIEDIYPTSPMQNGMLLAQSQSRALYSGQSMFKVINPTGRGLTGILEKAWLAIVRKHSILRTRFLECGHGDKSLFLQVVTRKPFPCIRTVHIDSLDDLRSLDTSLDWQQMSSLALLTIYHGPGGETYCRLDIHHTSYDAHSIDMLLDDFVHELNNTSININWTPYRNFVAYLAGQDEAATEAHWRDELAGAAMCHFPVQGGSADFTSTFGREGFLLSTETSQAIHKLCLSSRITVSTFFKAIWTIVLRTYTGSEDTVFGVVTSGRDIPVTGCQEIMGPLLTLLLCRCQLTGSASFAQLLQEMHTDYLRNLPFQHYPLMKIHHALGLRRGQRLFNTSFNFLVESDLAKTSYDSSWITLETISGTGEIEYDLSLTVEASTNAIRVAVDYWTSCLSPKQSLALTSAMKQLIDEVVANPLIAIDSIDWFCHENLAPPKLLSHATPAGVERTIHQRVQAQARSQPNRTALQAGQLMMTYGELSTLSHRLASYLVKRGLCGRQNIPFCIEKGPLAPVAMLSINMAGSAFVPMDPSHPAQRLLWLVREVQAQVVLCSRYTASQIEKANLTGITVIVIEDAIRSRELESALPEVSPSDTAYVVFTSGSTGTPKGIVMRHEAACQSIASCAEAFHIGPESRSLQFSAHTWDAIICELFSTLFCGGVVCIPSDEQRMNSIVDFIKTHAVTWMFLTPSVLRLIDPHSLGERKDLIVVTIGEPLSRGLFETWKNFALMINAYGPTETGIACTAEVLEAAPQGSIGKAFGCRAWVVSPKNCNIRVPVGAVGELLIESTRLADGYLNDPVKTAAIFPRPPNWARQHAETSRYYRTGDLVKQDETTGSLTFFGRIGTQVKISGQRVELSEVEMHLGECSDIDRVIAIVARNGVWQGKLAAIFTIKQKRGLQKSIEPKRTESWSPSRPGEESDADCVGGFRSAMEERLPLFMIPSLWIPLESLPITSSGKIDRQLIARCLENESLFNFVVESDGPVARHLQPTTSAQKLIQAIWAEELRLPCERIGINQSFLSLGGDSLTAIRVASRSRALNVTVSVQDLLRRRTIEQIAEGFVTVVAEPQTGVEGSHSRRRRVENGNGIGTGSSSALSTSTRQYPSLRLLHLDSEEDYHKVLAACCQQLSLGDFSGVEAIYPCSPMQGGLFMAKAQGVETYDQRFCWKISGPTSHATVIKLQDAWQGVVDRHTILRTAFIDHPLENFNTAQVVLRKSRAPISVIKIKDFDDFQCHLRGLARLHHMTIGETSRGEIFCCLDFNHTIGDATSVLLMLQDLSSALNGAAWDREAPKYESFISYIMDMEPEAALKYWQEQLSDVEVCQFPTDQDRRDKSASSVESSSMPTLMHKTIALESDHQAGLGSLCRQQGITPATVFNTLWALVLRFFISKTDVCFGYLASGRDIEVSGAQDIVGPLVTLMVCAVKLESTHTMLDLAQMIQDHYIQSLPHQHYSLAQVFNDIGLQGKRLFNTTVNVLQTWALEDSNGCADRLSFDMINTITPSEFDISLDAAYSSDATTLTLAYKSDYLSEFMATNILNTLSRLLEVFVINPETPIKEIDVCDHSQIQAITNWTPREPGPVSSASCVHEAVSWTVSNSPHAEAVCAHDGTWTYQELWYLSGQLAELLSGLGVGPEVSVAFCLEKTKWSIVAILAILRARGCCVPMDPSYPESRLRSMLDQVGAQIVLTSNACERIARKFERQVITLNQARFASLGDGRSVEDLGKPNDAAYIIFVSPF